MGEHKIHIPRDRDNNFEPTLIPKHSRRFDEFDEFDDKILSLYARGMSVSDIKSQLDEMYGVDVSTSLISTVTDAVISEVKTWQSRPLERVYLDCIVVKVREDKRIINKSVYLAPGVNTKKEKASTEAIRQARLKKSKPSLMALKRSSKTTLPESLPRARLPKP